MFPVTIERESKCACDLPNYVRKSFRKITETEKTDVWGATFEVPPLKKQHNQKSYRFQISKQISRFFLYYSFSVYDCASLSNLNNFTRNWVIIYKLGLVRNSKHTILLYQSSLF